MKSHNFINVHRAAIAAVLFLPGCDAVSDDGEALAEVSVMEVEEEGGELGELLTKIQNDSTITADDFEAGTFAEARRISLAEARVRLARQVLASDFATASGSELGDGFGGAWIDVADSDVIKIGVTSLGRRQAETIDRMARKFGLDGGYRAVEVRHSLAALEEANNFLAAHLLGVNPHDGPSLVAGLRTDLNAVELQTPEVGELSTAQQRLVATARARFGALLVVSSYHGRPTARGCTYPDCSPPLRGGIRITNAGHVCTGGFYAKSNSDSKPYQLTAGHCTAAVAGDWSAYFANKEIHVIGAAWSSKWSSVGDMAILRINNPAGWQPMPWINVTTSANTVSDPEYKVSADSTALQGKWLCTAGASYGRASCGSVIATGVSASYGGVTVNNLSRVSFCGTQGDSGAPVYASHVAFGMQVGGLAACDTLMQNIQAAELALNVSVVHG